MLQQQHNILPALRISCSSRDRGAYDKILDLVEVAVPLLPGVERPLEPSFMASARSALERKPEDGVQDLLFLLGRAAPSSLLAGLRLQVLSLDRLAAF